MKRLLPIFLCGLLSACALSSDVPEDIFYRLGEPQPSPVARQFAGSIGVQQLEADGLHSERALLYSEDAGHRSLRQYHYHYWQDSPRHLVQAYLVSYLRNTGLSALVARHRSGLEADLEISGRLLRFELLRGEAEDSVVVEMELLLREAGLSRIRMLRNYKGQVVIAGGGMQQVVGGFEAALATIGADLTRDLADYLLENPS